MSFGIRSIVPKVVAVAIACAGLGLVVSPRAVEAAPITVPAEAAAAGNGLAQQVVHHWGHRHHRHHRRYHHHHRHGHGWHHRRRHFDNHYPTRPRRWH